MPSKYGWVFVNPYMTLVAAYERLIEGRGIEINDMVVTPIGPAAAGPATVANTTITTGSIPSPATKVAPTTQAVPITKPAPTTKVVHATKAAHATTRPTQRKRSRRPKDDDDDDD